MTLASVIDLAKLSEMMYRVRMWMWCDSLGNIIEHLTQAERGMRAGGLGVQGVSGKVCNAKILQH